MGLFNSIFDTAVDVAFTPVAVAQDVLEFGTGERDGELNTVRQIKEVVSDLKQVGEDL